MSQIASRQKELAHDRLASRFDELMDDYDVTRRIEVLIERFLEPVNLEGAFVLDAGCGVGAFTRALVAKGARVVALDIGAQLAAATRQRCRCAAVVGTLTDLGFASNVFDVVVSSEAIEHTPDPERALHELYRMVKPGGYFVVSTPNRLWQGPVRAASRLGLRPYDGYENFLWPSQLRRILELEGASVIGHRGIHLWPFQLKLLTSVSRYVDRFGEPLLGLMINQCLCCRKPIASSSG